LTSSNRATNAPYAVLQGSTVLGTLAVNQRLAPADFTDAGAAWKDLGGPYQITGTSLTVRLTDQANGVVVADAVRVQLILPQQPAAMSATAVQPAASAPLARALPMIPQPRNDLANLVDLAAPAPAVVGADLSNGFPWQLMTRRRRLGGSMFAEFFDGSM
jgi:hypothetical protein